MRLKNLNSMDVYAGEVFKQPAGMRRRYKGVCNGPTSIYVGAMLYSYCGGGDFDVEVYAPVDIEVTIRSAKGVDVALAFPIGPTVVKGDPANSWTKDEPRPSINPQLAAIMAQMKQLEHRLASSEQMRLAASQKAQETVSELSGAPTPDDTQEAPEVAPEAAEDDTQS